MLAPGGALNVDIVGGLKRLGINEIEAKQHHSKLREGNVLVAAHTNSREEAQLVRYIFKFAGIKEFSREGEEAVSSCK